MAQIGDYDQFEGVVWTVDKNGDLWAIDKGAPQFNFQPVKLVHFAFHGLDPNGAPIYDVKSDGCPSDTFVNGYRTGIVIDRITLPAPFNDSNHDAGDITKYFSDVENIAYDNTDGKDTMYLVGHSLTYGNAPSSPYVLPNPPPLFTGADLTFRNWNSLAAGTSPDPLRSNTHTLIAAFKGWTGNWAASQPRTQTHWASTPPMADWITPFAKADGNENSNANLYPKMTAAGDYLFVGHYGSRISILEAATGKPLNQMLMQDAGTVPNASLGWLDFGMPLTSFRRQNGDYFVTAEEVFHETNVVYRWHPPAYQVASGYDGATQFNMGTFGADTNYIVAGSASGDMHALPSGSPDPDKPVRLIDYSAPTCWTSYPINPFESAYRIDYNLFDRINGLNYTNYDRWDTVRYGKTNMYNLVRFGNPVEYSFPMTPSGTSVAKLTPYAWYKVALHFNQYNPASFGPYDGYQRADIFLNQRQVASQFRLLRTSGRSIHRACRGVHGTGRRLRITRYQTSSQRLVWL